MGRVVNKVAIVTGGSQGLGKADCEALVREGAKVMITDIKTAEGEQLAADLNAQRAGSAAFLQHDVRDESRWEFVVGETVKQFGRLDILVNNAGLVIPATPESTTLEQFRLHNAVMSEGVFLGCKHAIPAMHTTGGGSIINMASVATHLGYPVFFAYSAAKGAVRGMTKAIAVWCQMQKYNIRCNSVHPGATDTPMVAEANKLLGIPDEFYTQSGPGLGRPLDVANVVVFLASDESRFINGAELVLDNCLTIQ
ncbi:MAG: SDR family oxidoreductase [Gammaproteobacteria bacterium]|jgi:3(or 17)beta-hydroxysteroid dehydrogenase|nr:SDR family oxidoreductase [Gammaproteobacteria bacterium]